MYFKPSQIAIAKKYFTYLLLIMTIFLGYSSYQKLPKEWSPDVQIPILYLIVPYPGSSAEDVENIVTYKLEKELKGIEQVKEITSHSVPGVSTIQLEFELGFDIESAKNEVRSAWDNVQVELPDDVETIQIEEINLSEAPILTINLAGGGSSLHEMKQVAEDIQDEIEAISGVLEAPVIGGLEREIQIEVDPYLLDYYKITLDEVSRAVSATNRDIPAGDIDLGISKIQIRIPGMINQVNELEHFVIASREGTPIYLRDVAQVRDSYKEIKSLARIDNQNAVSVDVKKKAGENLIRITKETEAIVKKYTENYPEYRFSIINKQSTIVEDRLTELQNNIALGFLLVFIVLLFFMGFKSALIVGSAIPISMLMSFAILRMLDVSINMVVLFALVLALGMLVDNVIVVVENIYRHLSLGKEKTKACLEGVTEVAYPIISSTLTTLAAFFPLLFMPGIIGDFMKYLPITLISTLSASLFVAFIFATPIAHSTLNKFSAKKNSNGDILRENEQANKNRFLKTYGKVLSGVIRFRYLAFLVFIAIWIGSFVLYSSQGLGVIFFPQTEPATFTLKVEASPGTNFQTMSKIMGHFEEIILEFSEYSSSIVSKIGYGGSGESSNEGRITFEFPENWRDWKELPTETINKVRKALNQNPAEHGGVQWEISKQADGPPTGKDINIEVTGNRLATLDNLANQVKNEIADLEGIVNLNDDLDLSQSELEIRIDREKLALYNITFSEVANFIRTAFYGTTASTYRIGEDEYDIKVRVMEEYRLQPSDLMQLRLLTRNNSIISLGQVASMDLNSSINKIKHIDRTRVVTISADAEGVPSITLLNQVKEKLQDFSLPSGYQLLFTGGNEDQKESQEFLIEAFIIAIFLIFLILVAQFNSFSLPFIILFSVFMSIIGIFIGYTIHQLPFSTIMGGIGAVSLAGIVVNNSIVLIDYAQQLRNKGFSYKEAIVTSCQLRLRPVFLTAITSITSLFPIIFKMDIDMFRAKFSLSPFQFDISEIILFGSPSSEFWLPLSYITLYGLAFATILTLFFVPTLYCLNEDRKRFFSFLFQEARSVIKKLKKSG